MYQQIRNLLIALIALPGFALASPHRLQRKAVGDEPGCSDTSFNHFEWTVSNLAYNSTVTYTTPAHQNAWATFNFDIFNPAVNLAASCSGSSSRPYDFFYGDIQYTCTSSPGYGPTTFDYDHISGLLRVNESWVCSDQDPVYPYYFTARGNVTLDLDCSTTTYNNPNWTMGDIYSQTTVTCKPISLPVKPNEMEAIA